MSSIKLQNDQPPCSVTIQSDETTGTAKVNITLTPYQLDDTLMVAPQPQPTATAQAATSLSSGLEQPASTKPKKATQAMQAALQKDITQAASASAELDLTAAQAAALAKANLNKAPSKAQQVGANMQKFAKTFFPAKAQGYEEVANDENDEAAQPLLQTRLSSDSSNSDPQAEISPLPVSTPPAAPTALETRLQNIQTAKANLSQRLDALNAAAPQKPTLMQKLRNLGTRIGNFFTSLYANFLLAISTPSKAADVTPEENDKQA